MIHLGELLEINRLLNENDCLAKTIAQMKYYRTPKGVAKMQRDNEKRRNMTKFKAVMKQILSVSALTRSLSNSFTPVSLKQGKALRFI